MQPRKKAKWCTSSRLSPVSLTLLRDVASCKIRTMTHQVMVSKKMINYKINQAEKQKNNSNTAVALLSTYTSMHPRRGCYDRSRFRGIRRGKKQILSPHLSEPLMMAIHNPLSRTTSCLKTEINLFLLKLKKTHTHNILFFLYSSLKYEENTCTKHFLSCLPKPRKVQKQIM